MWISPARICPREPGLQNTYQGQRLGDFDQVVLYALVERPRRRFGQDARPAAMAPPNDASILENKDLNGLRWAAGDRLEQVFSSEDAMRLHRGSHAAALGEWLGRFANLKWSIAANGRFLPSHLTASRPPAALMRTVLADAGPAE